MNKEILQNNNYYENQMTSSTTSIDKEKQKYSISKSGKFKRCIKKRPALFSDNKQSDEKTKSTNTNAVRDADDDDDDNDVDDNNNITSTHKLPDEYYKDENCKELNKQTYAAAATTTAGAGAVAVATVVVIDT